MREFQSTVSKVLKEHKKNKRYLAFLLALSMIVSVAVPFSLIMPAVSMTHDEEIPQGNDFDNISGDSGGLTLLSLSDTVSRSAPDAGMYPKALDISTADNGFNMTIGDAGSDEHYLYNSYDGGVNSGYGEVSGDSLNLEFNLEYSFSNKKDYFNIDSDERYMYVSIDLSSGLVLSSETKTGPVWDSDYSISEEAGTYEIKDDYVLITLTDGYINHINSGGGAITGSLNFEGTISHNANADSEQKITIAGQEVPVTFQEKKPTLTKRSNVNSDGTITWTVTINNENGLDLSNYTLEDDMLTVAKEVTFTPDVGNHNNGENKITFNASATDNSVTITYKTDITVEQLKGTDGSRTNTATLKKGDTPVDEKDSTANISYRPIIVEKTGKADYENGKTHSNKIDWEIKVTSEHGTSLKDYIIEDANIPNNGIEITPAGVTLVPYNGAWKLNVPDGMTASEVIIRYQSDIDPDPNNGNKTKNVVKVEYPDGTPVPDGEKEAQVEYKQKSDLIGFTKNGSYNPDTHVITWTITVTPENGFSLNGYVLKDSQFPSSLDDFTVQSEWSTDYKDKVELNGNELKFKEDCNITNKVVIRYTQKVENLPAEGSTSVASNDIGDNNHTETTVATVPVTGKRNEFSKNLIGSTSETVTNSKDITKTLNWKAEITLDDSLAGKVYKDTLSATGDGVTHTLNEDSIVVKAKKEQYGQTSILTKDVDYFVSQNGDSFEVKFADGIDAGYNYVTIEYNTTATADEPANADFTEITYTFSNKGEFNGKTDADNSFGLTRGNPNKTETMDLGVKKDWDDENNNANERPSTVYFKLKYYSTTNNWYSSDDNDWDSVKKSGDNYLFSGDAGYESAGDYIISVSGNDWKVNLTGLPKEVTKANSDGSQGATIHYYYKLEEVDASGNAISYITTANGIYEVGNSNILNYAGELSVKNIYHKNIDVTVEKKWADDDSNTANRKPITVELWRSTTQGYWDGHEVIGTQVLNDANNWTYTGWNNLPSTVIQDGNLVTYYYIAVETKYGDTPISEENNIVFLDNGYYNFAIKSGNTNVSGTLTITNTFHENVTVKPSKNWQGDTIDGDITEITVQLQRRAIGSNEWNPVGNEITLKAVDNWGISDSQAWSNLERINENGNEYYYKVVETSVKTSSGKVIEITTDKYVTDNGYYDVTDSGDSNNALYWNNNVKELQVTNTFHKTKSLEISAKKVWDDTKNEIDYSSNRPTAIIIALQKSANNGNWETIEEQTLNVAGDEQTYSWSNGLISQSVDADGKVTTYRYRVVEVGYVYDGKTYKLPEGTSTFATKEDEGSYEGTYKIGSNSNNVLNESGEVVITNTFTPLDTLEITPQKKWAGDQESNRPASVKLRLQQKLGSSGWNDAKDASGNLIEVTLQSNPDTDTWNGATISNLPKQKVVSTEIPNEDGTFTKTSKLETYSYRLVEVVDGNVLEDGDSFRISGGLYKVTLQSNDVNYTSVYTVTNTYEKYVGITKNAYDENGIELPSSIDKEEFEKWKEEGKLITDTFDGEEYYIFNWMVKYDLEDWGNGYGLPTVKDHLPDDFTLCEDTSYLGSAPGASGGKWSDYWWISGYSEESGFEYLTKNKFQKNYIVHPSIVYPDVKYACGGMLAESIDFIYEKVMINNNDIFNGNPDFWYYYDKENNDVYFNKYKATSESRVWYAIKIKCSVLEEKVSKGTYVIENTAYTYEDGSQDKNKRVPTGQTTGSLTIVNKAPSNLITKEYKSQGIPGYIGFSLDVNPDGKNLSNGDTIDIEDIFKTDSYLDKDKNNQLTQGENLVDVLMNNIKLYAVDVNGNKTLLDKSEYTLKFESNENGVANRDGETGAGLLKLTVPDETHIVIDYIYKLIANNNTPSVINGCKSSTRVNGKFPVMEPGMIPPGGDEVTFTNKAKLYSDSASADDSVKEQKYEISKSSSTISTNTLPKVKKVNVGNYGINNLEAKFLLARYDQSQQKWFYATRINQGEEITEWSEGVTGLTVAKGAVQINVDTNYSYQLSLSKDSLYKLVEVKVPDGYEGSNLGLSDAEFEQLIVNYLNDQSKTELKGKDYAVFLKNYVPVYYFVYNSVMTSYPDGLKASDVIQVKSGEDIEIPNNQLIDIDVTKNWNDGNESKENDEIEVTLYWSHTKASTGMPSDAKIATREDLGLMDENFSAVQTAKTGENKKVWENLPNGKDGKPVYYYIKETSYTIGDKTYELDEETGVYKNGTQEGGYLPTYVGNAANADSVITVNNSQQLMLKKVWKNASNYPLGANKIPTDSILVDIYGTTKLDVEEKIFEGIEITKDGNWECDITSELESKDINLADYKSFRAEESGFDTTGYVVSCVFNLNADTGEITITNKSTVATEASITVNKVWSDGEAVHKNDKIKVTLYQSTSEIRNIAGMTQEDFGKAMQDADAKPMDKISPDDTQIYQDVVLNADNEWMYTWTGLPLDDGDESNPEPYYYYVLEDMSDMENCDKYTATYTATKSGAKTQYTVKNTRQAIVVQKQWFDENGEQIIDIFDEDGNLVINNTGDLPEIELKLYKQNATQPESGLKLIAFGDSITDGYGECSRNGSDYPSKLVSSLAQNGYTIVGSENVSDNINKGQSRQQIGESENTGFRSRIKSDIPSDTNIICFLGGTNDIHQGGNGKGNPDEVYRRFEACIEEIKAHATNAVIFVGSIPHFDFYKNGTLTEGGSWWSETRYTENDGKLANDLIDQYNAKIKAYAEDTDGVYFVDVCSIVVDDYIRADGCHPNDAGYTAIANAYYTAINNYYATKEYVQENDSDKMITLNQANNWTAVVDVPDNGNYYIEEVNVPEGWEVSYSENQGTQKPGTATPIVVKNTKQEVPKTSISIQKTWVGDSADTSRRDKISFSLMRKTENTDWEEVLVDMPEPQKVENIWTYVYTELPAKDNLNQNYYYKVIEDDLDGYKATYDSNSETGLQAVGNGNTGTFAITNTRLISLKLKKVWADESDKQGKITVDIYRSINPEDVPDAELILQVPATASVGVEKETVVKANKPITSVSANNDNVTATIDETDKTRVIITGITEGSAIVTVSDGKDSADITVTVSQMSLAISSDSIVAGKTAVLSVEKNEGNVTYSASPSDCIRIDGNTVTGLNDGVVTITATDTKGNTASITLTVTLPDSFTLISTVEDGALKVGQSLQLTPNPDYGKFEYSSDDVNVATVDENGNVTAEGAGTAIITVTRMSYDNKVMGKQTFQINVSAFQPILVENGSKLVELPEDFSSVSKITITIYVDNISNVYYNNAAIYLCPHPDNLYWETETLQEIGQNEWETGKTYVYEFENWNATSGVFNFTSNSITYTIENIVYSYATPANFSLRTVTANNATAGIMPLAEEEPYRTVDITATTNWETVVEELDVYDENGQPYYYWVVEKVDENSAGYDVSYLFEDDDNNTDDCINSGNLGAGAITIRNTKQESQGVAMPSTGGQGVGRNYTAGAILMGSSAVAYILIRRRKKRAS